MAFSTGGSGGLTSEPNMTPMIDVLLVLLIIFMMIVPASRKAIDIQLPDPNPQTQPANPTNDQIVLEVLPGGYYEVNNEPIRSPEALGPRLKEIFTGRPQSLIFIKGAPDVKYQDVIFAMDVARGAGVKIIGVPPADAEPAKVGK